MIENLRNIAIIAHVDHGKTTLVDKLLQQSGTFDARAETQERVMDSNDLEKERGITILAKNTAIKWNDYRINIVDTPGHADFGGEVERVMSMVDSVLLVVDAMDGPMPQTRFVTKKAFAHGLKPIVVINKVDRPGARPDWVVDQVFDLFVNLDATDEQLDFPIVYASALNGIAGLDHEDMAEDMTPLYQAIVDRVPAPNVDLDGTLQMQISQLDYNNYVGVIGIGRIKRGKVKPNQQVTIIDSEGKTRNGKVGKVLTHLGLERIESDIAEAGDIIAITGLGELNISDTICDPHYNLFLGPLQSKRHFFEVFASSVPLIFTGLALGLVFKSGNFSMIADACLYTGAVVTAALAIKTSLPFAVHPIVIMIAAAAVGGVIGSIPALLKVYFHTNELVTSLMFNYVFFYLGIYNVTKFLADREAGTFASKKYQATAALGKLIPGTNFHVGYLIAIAAVIALYILVYKTKFGYEVRISGSNPEFAKYSGIRTSRVIIMTQIIAGAVAGLGGAVEQMGMYQRFNWQDSPSYAWDGVIIAILSGNNPKMVPFAAFFLAYIRVGADLMSRRSDVQNELVSIIQAVLILFVTAERFMAGWKQREEAKKALKGEA